MKTKYVPENLEDFLKSSESGYEVRYVGDAGQDPYLNARTITPPYTNVVESIARCGQLKALGLLAGEIPWELGRDKPDWRTLIKWRLPRRAI